MKLPLLTEHLGRTGGTFTPSPTDFFVEEIPLYLPSGDGDHLYIQVEKTDLTTRSLVQHAVATFKVSERDVGYAGLKDRNARTVQTISVLGAKVDDAAQLETHQIRVLSAGMHRNKLKVGHLAGNRFEATIRDETPDAAQTAKAILAHMETHGLANFYGAQRFGAGGTNVERARTVLRKGPRAAGSRWKAKLLVSALQSHLFNQYLIQRVQAEQFATVHAGDVLVKVESGGPFVCDDPATDQPRHDAFEVSISGPIFGRKMRQPGEGTEPAAWESAVMDQAQLTLDDFSKVRKFAAGTRRPTRVPVQNTQVQENDDGIIVQFTLPPGSYATVLMDEIIKAPSAA